MNNYEQLEEILAQEFDVRHKWRVIYVNDEQSLSLLQKFFIKEWSIKHTIADYKGGVYYTIQQPG